MKDFKQIVNENIKKKKTFVFVSPHFDDAVYSAGGLISYLSEIKAKVEIINVFTKADKPPYTLSAKHNLHMSGFSDAQELYKVREKEDRAVLRKLGVKLHNLGFKEALYRKNNNKINPLFAKILPELIHIYPSYRFHILKGVVSKKDKNLMDNISEFLAKNVDRNSIVFCPLSQSSHTDHEIVKRICQKIFGKNLIYWQDYPYNLKSKSGLSDFGRNKKLNFFVFYDSQKEREDLIRGYGSQLNGLFAGNKITLMQEKYFILEGGNL